MDEARTPGAKRAGPGEYVFNMHDVNSIMGGPGYSPVFGGCVEGERMIVALMRYPAGKPSEAHSHPNEQWIFILEGELEMQFDGRCTRRAGRGVLRAREQGTPGGQQRAKDVVSSVQGRIARPARQQSLIRGQSPNCYSTLIFASRRNSPQVCVSLRTSWSNSWGDADTATVSICLASRSLISVLFSAAASV